MLIVGSEKSVFPHSIIRSNFLGIFLHKIELM
jgi:hypothetical protein